jgi:hypothetical protein
MAARVMGATFWGGPEVAADNKPPEDPRWRVSAIYGSGTNKKLRVEFRNPAKPALVLGVGDSLPSGHRITEIGDRDYCVQVGSRRYTLGVERSE